jgi:hypothetical protein
MGKLITIGVIVGAVFMYGHYVVEMQQQAMQNLNVLKYQYTHADEIVANNGNLK